MNYIPPILVNPPRYISAQIIIKRVLRNCISKLFLLDEGGSTEEYHDKDLAVT